MYIFTNKALERRDNLNYGEGWAKGNSESTQVWQKEYEDLKKYYENLKKNNEENKKLEFESLEILVTKAISKLDKNMKKQEILDTAQNWFGMILDALKTFKEGN